MRYSMLAIFMLLFHQLYAQTTVIWVVTDTGIFVGADSRAFAKKTSNLGNVKIFKTDSVCKIVNVGKYNFAIVGYFPDVVRHKAIEACKKGGTFSEVGAFFRKIFLDSMIDGSAKGNFDYPDSIKGMAYSIVTFFGYENDSAKILMLGTDFVKSGDDIVPKHYSSRKNLDGIGKTSAITRYLNHNYLDKHTQNRINKLIELQKGDTPLEVGGPVDILKVTKDGHTWLQNKDHCY